MAGFSPQPVSTYAFNVGTTSTTITLPARPGTVRIYNGGAVTAFIEVGPNAVIPTVGTPGACPLAQGAGSIPLLFEKGLNTQISAITATGTTTLYITMGHGDTVG